MKTLYLIGGTMGVGRAAQAELLKLELKPLKPEPFDLS